MEIPLRAALIDWLATDPVLHAHLNVVTEEAPLRASLPWLAIGSSSSTDWGCKTHAGREVKIALDLQCRGDQPDSAATLVAAIEARVDSLPRLQAGWRVVSIAFQRASVEQRAESRRSVVIEYRFRLLAQ